jgi:hypothetical protein
VSRDLVPAFVKLIKDGEAEVRTAIAGQIPGFCALVDRNTLLNDIMPAIEDLVSDSSQHVRAALGTQISGLAPILGKQEFVVLACVSSCFETNCALTGLSITSYPCSYRCLRTNSPKSGCTSSRNWNSSTKVGDLSEPGTLPGFLANYM